MKRAAIVLGLPLLFVLAGHAPGAWACSCVGGLSQEDYAEMADVVFVGTVVGSSTEGSDGEVRSSGEQVTWSFDVRRVEKGRDREEAAVRSPIDDATCGYTFRAGHRYRVYAYAHDGSLQTNSCSGNEHLGVDPTYEEEPVAGGDEPVSTPPDESPDRLDGTDGAPEPQPTADGREPAPTDERDGEQALEVLPVSAPGDEAGGAPVALVVAAGVLVVGVGAALVRRRARA